MKGKPVLFSVSWSDNSWPYQVLFLTSWEFYNEAREARSAEPFFSWFCKEKKASS